MLTMGGMQLWALSVVGGWDGRRMNSPLFVYKDNKIIQNYPLNHLHYNKLFKIKYVKHICCICSLLNLNFNFISTHLLTNKHLFLSKIAVYGVPTTIIHKTRKFKMHWLSFTETYKIPPMFPIRYYYYQQ